MNREHVQMGAKALTDYLNYIGINVSGYHEQHDYQERTSMSFTQPTNYIKGVVTSTFECICKEEAYIYVSKFAQLQEIIVNPVVNRDALYGGCFQADGQPVESVFAEEKYFRFQIIIRAYGLDELDKFIIKLKKDTEPLRYKRFNEEMDKQITEELSKDT